MHLPIGFMHLQSPNLCFLQTLGAISIHPYFSSNLSITSPILFYFIWCGVCKPIYAIAFHSVPLKHHHFLSLQTLPSSSIQTPSILQCYFMFCIRTLFLKKTKLKWRLLQLQHAQTTLFILTIIFCKNNT